MRDSGWSPSIHDSGRRSYASETKRGETTDYAPGFMSLRLNIPTRTDERELIPAHQWEAVLARPVPPREGQAVLGLDLGAARSWSAAALWWRNGRAGGLREHTGHTRHRRSRAVPGVWSRGAPLHGGPGHGGGR